MFSESKTENLYYSKTYKKNINRNTSLTFTWVKLCKRPEGNGEPAHFLDNDKAFSS